MKYQSQLDIIKEFTDGEIESDENGNAFGVSFQSKLSRFEILTGQRTERWALIVNAGDVIFHCEFPASEVIHHPSDTPINISALVFHDLKTGKQVLSINRRGEQYAIDPICNY